MTIHTPGSGPVLAQVERPGLYDSYTADDPKDQVVSRSSPPTNSRSANKRL